MVTRRAFGTSRSHCKNCDKPETFKLIDGDGSHTYKCGCGCTIYRYHPPDKFHSQAYFIKVFVPEYAHRKNFKKLTVFEKKGFKKKELNGKTVYEKGGV